MQKKSLHSFFLLLVALTTILLFSCTKKYDWECTCQIYHDTMNVTEVKEIKDVRKPDADRICAKFGDDVSPPGTVHECRLK